MNHLKKIITSILLVSLTLVELNLAVSAETVLEAVSDVSVLSCDSNATDWRILTNSVPDDATAFAKDIFSSFEVKNLTGAGYSKDEILDLRLGYGFDLLGCDIETYLFPAISSNNEIIAILNVAKINGDYSWEVSHRELSQALNGLKSSEPFEVLATPIGYYAVFSNGTSQFLASDSNVITDEAAERASQILDGLKNDVVDFLAPLNDKKVVEVSYDFSFESVKLSTSYPEAYTYKGIIRDVPYVQNKSVQGLGVCWAASMASILKYKGMVSDAALERDHLIDMQEGSNSDGRPTATIYDTKKIFDNIFGTDLTIVSDRQPTWVQVQKQINNYNSPYYTIWEIYSNGSLSNASSHAMVVRGYCYDDTDPDNAAKCWVYLMDPNKSASTDNVLPNSAKNGDDSTLANVANYNNPFHLVNSDYYYCNVSLIGNYGV